MILHRAHAHINPSCSYFVGTGDAASVNHGLKLILKRRLTSKTYEKRILLLHKAPKLVSPSCECARIGQTLARHICKAMAQEELGDLDDIVFGLCNLRRFHHLCVN